MISTSLKSLSWLYLYHQTMGLLLPLLFHEKAPEPRLKFNVHSREISLANQTLQYGALAQKRFKCRLFKLKSRE